MSKPSLKPQTSVQVEIAFRAELAALLARYDGPVGFNGWPYVAELSAKDHYQGYPECGEDVRMTVEIPALYDEDGNCTREWTTIDLGTRFP